MKLEYEDDDKIISEWAAKWWNWYLSENSPDNRMVDDVLFLNGWPDDKEAIELDIPANTRIFFPLIDSMYILGDKNFFDRDLDDNILKSEEQISHAFDREKTYDKAAYIIHPPDNDEPMNTLSWKRIKYYKFNLTVHENCRFRHSLENRLPAQTSDQYQARGSGYYIFIKPLEPTQERYHIHFEAKGEVGYKRSGTYNIRVNNPTGQI